MASELMWHVAEETNSHIVVTHNGRMHIDVGKTLKLDRPPVLYTVGFHACPRLTDALFYSPPMPHPVVCQVRLGGKTVQGYKGIVQAGQERTCVRMWDHSLCVALLRRFSYRLARETLGYWSPPAVVRDYFETEDDRLYTAAFEAVRDGRGPSKYDGAVFYAFSTARTAILGLAERASFRWVKYLAEKAACVDAYNGQGRKQAHLSSEGELYYLDRLNYYNEELTELFMRPEEPVF